MLFCSHQRFAAAAAFSTAVPSRLPILEYAADDDLRLFHLLSQRRLYDARQLLDDMRDRRVADVVTWTRILNRYANRGYVNQARALFDVMPERNVVTWNSMISAYVRTGDVVAADQLFRSMPCRNLVSYTCMVDGLARGRRICEAKRLFDVMPERNVVSCNVMISGLVRNGELSEARELFNAMPERNVVSWNAMIAGYAEKLRMDEARRLFDEMGCTPNVVTWTSLISGYCRVGDVGEAYSLFCEMPEKNVVSWTAMIGGLVWNCKHREALQLFSSMKKIGRVEPNKETFISLFYACACLVLDRLGKQIHGHLLVNGRALDDHDDKLLKSLVYMYSKFGNMDISSCLFHKLGKYDSVLLNIVINGYAQTGMLGKARALFDEVSIRDEISCTSIIAGYFNEGDVEEAMLLFNEMPIKDAVSWTVVISGLVQNELFSEAISFFNKMRASEVTATENAYSSLLGATGTMAYLFLGQQIHCHAIKTLGNFDTIMSNSLISMYAKCGDLNEAYQIFNIMTNRDIISWNSMIFSLSFHGQASDAHKLLELMLKSWMTPNSVTFLALLSACSHSGLVTEGWNIFHSMVTKYSIEPNVQHYACMVDLLGRAGKLIEAKDFVNKVPVKQGPALWGALLGSCGIRYNNMLVGKYAAQKFLELDPFNAPAHVLLCNMHAANGEYKEETILRKTMGVKGVKKSPGCSWIVLKGEVHVFLSGDVYHPESNRIFLLLSGACG